MFTDVDIHSEVAVYTQIENHIRFAISSGELKAGSQLPSVRELSEKVKVNPNTVAKAYRDLEVMGLLYTRRGMGVFIRDGVSARCRSECRRQIIESIFNVVAEAKAAGLTKADLLAALDRSLALTVNPYSEPPASVFASAKSKTKSPTRKKAKAKHK